MKKAVIVIPTYNEAENIQKVTSKIYDVAKGIKDYDIYILVVDDNSPDKTYEIVEKISKKNKNVMLLKRKEKSGLGTAYIEGFKYSFKKINPDVIFQMDADLSHDPKEIPTFLDKIENYDVVIGSRYVKGGKILNWGPWRKTVSFFGNFFARVVTGVYRVHDCTTGYRAIRTNLLKKIDLDNINIHGYAFLLGLLHAMYKKGARIKEIPITFLDREYGKSKLTKKDMVEFFINSFRLRFKK